MALAAALMVQPHLYIGDGTGKPLDYGTIYFGEVDKDPEFYPIDIFYDPNLTISAAQPVRTKGGFMYGNGDMVEIYAAEQSYSVKVIDEYGKLVFYKPVMTRTIDSKTVIEADSFFIAPMNGNGVNVFEYREAVDLIFTIVPAGIYLKDSAIAKGVVLDMPRISNIYERTTLDAPNLVLAADGTLKASTRKAGILENDLVVRDAGGYPVNNNAIGVGQTWQNLTASRAKDTVYTNDTGRPITVNVTAKTSSGTISSLSLLAYVNGVLVSEDRTYSVSSGYAVNISIVIPAGSTYKFESVSVASSSITLWSELR